MARGCAADMGGGVASGGGCTTVWPVVVLRTWGGGVASRGGCITVWPVVVLRTWGGEGGFWRRVCNSVGRGCAADMGGGASRGGCITVWAVVVLRTWGGGVALLEAGV